MIQHSNQICYLSEMRKISFLVFAFFFCACQSSSPENSEHAAFERERAKIANVKALPLSNEKYTPPTKIAYTEPKTGMNMLDFKALCGNPNHIRSYESKSGTMWIYEYENSDRHAKSRCWGTFRFSNGELEYISR